MFRVLKCLIVKSFDPKTEHCTDAGYIKIPQNRGFKSEETMFFVMRK